MKVLDILKEELPKYVHEVKTKNQENAKAIAFSSFIQKVFQVESKDLDFEVPVKTEVLELRGRIDAVFGNLIIEFKVIYAANGANMTCTVVESTKEYAFSISESEFKTNRFFVDMAMYYANTSSKDEAYYLSAILNSHTINEFIKPHQSRGDFGARNIHKSPLTYDIPKYDPNNDVHSKLSELGNICHTKSTDIVNNLDLKSIGTIRNRVREGLANEMKAIDELISKL